MTKNRESKVVFKLEFTTSKLLAYFIVLSATVAGIILKSTEVLIVGWTIGAGLSGVKTITDKKKSGDSLISSDVSENGKQLLNG